MRNCPHGNDCSPARRCGPCSGLPVRDGECVRATMALMDSAQRAAQRVIDANTRDHVPAEVRAQARRDNEEWKRQGQPIHRDGLSDYEARALAQSAAAGRAAMALAGAQMARSQAIRDHHGNASGVAYAEECARLQRGGRV